MEQVTLHVLGKIMTPYKAYVLILCLIVFVMLTTVFTAMMAALTKQALRLINVGAEDEKIYKEYAKRMKRGERKTGKMMDTLLSVLLWSSFPWQGRLSFHRRKRGSAGWRSRDSPGNFPDSVPGSPGSNSVPAPGLWRCLFPGPEDPGRKNLRGGPLW